MDISQLTLLNRLRPRPSTGVAPAWSLVMLTALSCGRAGFVPGDSNESPPHGQLQLLAPAVVANDDCVDITVTYHDANGLTPAPTALPLEPTQDGDGSFYLDSGCTRTGDHAIAQGNSAAHIYYRATSRARETTQVTVQVRSEFGAWLARKQMTVRQRVTAVAQGGRTTCFVVEERDVWCAGINETNVLGTEDRFGAHRSVPTRISPAWGPRSVGDIGMGWRFGCVLAEDGVWCWGDNSYGQLGAGTGPASSLPIQPTGLLAGVSALAVGSYNACAIRDGAVLCWGRNLNGVLGDGTSALRAVPAAVVGINGTSVSASNIAAGSRHACAVVSDGAARDGELMCWGDNGGGQLGAPAVTPGSNVPVTVVSSGVTRVAIGRGPMTCAIIDERAHCWGSDAFGGVGNGTPLEVQRSPTPVMNFDGATGNATMTTLAVGGRHACATADGQAWCWGDNRTGALGLGDTQDRAHPTLLIGLDDVTEMNTGRGDMSSATCAISRGLLRCWGKAVTLPDGVLRDNLAPTQVALPNAVDAVRSGGRASTTTCAVTEGIMHCWGSDTEGQLGNGAPLAAHGTPATIRGLPAPVTDFDVGEQTTCAIADASVYCWGKNASGTVGDGTLEGHLEPVAVIGLPAGATEVRVGRTACAVVSGGLMCWGEGGSGELARSSLDDSATPIAIAGMPAGSDVQHVATGGEHVCAIQAGEVWCWGTNAHGELGDGTEVPRSVPATVATLGADVTAISAGHRSTCAIAAGAVWCWGGVFGSGSLATTHPQQVPGITDARSISVGDQTACASNGAGAVWCWGANQSGQAGTASATSIVQPSEVIGLPGPASTVNVGGAVWNGCGCAIVQEALWCWGSNHDGQLGSGAPIYTLEPSLMLDAAE